MQVASIFMSAISSFVILTSGFTYAYQDRDIDNPLFLVNNDSIISEAYIPTMTQAKISGSERFLDVKAIESAEEMFTAAKNDGVRLNSFSSYRSFGTQKLIFTRKLNLSKGDFKAVNDYVAIPGSSEHQLGLAMDIVGSKPQLNDRFADTKEGKWIAENSYKYGFVIRYPKEHEEITGIKYEPWHIRYVGREAAKVIYQENISLEKYVSLQRLERYKELLAQR